MHDAGERGLRGCKGALLGCCILHYTHNMSYLHPPTVCSQVNYYARKMDLREYVVSDHVINNNVSDSDYIF